MTEVETRPGVNREVDFYDESSAGDLVDRIKSAGYKGVFSCSIPKNRLGREEASEKFLHDSKGLAGVVQADFVVVSILEDGTFYSGVARFYADRKD